MKIEYYKIPSDNIIKEFTDVMNFSFSQRKSIRNINPYTCKSPNEIKGEIGKNDIVFVIYDDMNSVIRGVILRIIINKGIISHLCIDPRYQGKGYAKLLLDYLIQYVSSNHNEIEYLQLIVGSVWKNAISLYKKLGFKIIKVEAHLPRTYYLITMVLNINGKYGYINGIKLFIRSYFIFKLFYKKDSSPSVIGKILKKCN